MNNGRRLDCQPYVSGAIEAKELLHKLNTTPLSELTAGHKGGIYNGSPFIRNYVEDPEHGVPFLTTSSMMQADLSHLPLLRKKDATSKRLSFLEIKPGMTLITCSGTIGRMVYARSDLDGVWSNQDILKVVADESKILPGYLYAFLSSRYGIPMVTGGVYGAIIQHIEPEHIAGLPVPRLDPSVEKEIHDLVQEATTALVEYQRLLGKATGTFFESVGLRDISSHEWHSWGSDLGFSRSPSQYSLRALNYNPRFERLCANIKSNSWVQLSEICKPGSLRRGDRFKRIESDEDHGCRLISQKQIFWLYPIGRWVSRPSVEPTAKVNENTILIAARGTLGEHELYSRPEFVYGEKVESAYSEDFLRIETDESQFPCGALFAFLRSQTGFRMLRSISMGSKLQDFHHELLHGLAIPKPAPQVMLECDKLIKTAYKLRQDSTAFENNARHVVEKAILKGGS
jgi:type I restriction enzyme S subunit